MLSYIYVILHVPKMVTYCVYNNMIAVIVIQINYLATNTKLKWNVADTFTRWLCIVIAVLDILTDSGVCSLHQRGRGCRDRAKHVAWYCSIPVNVFKSIKEKERNL